jgi:hypothetical protein
VVAFSLIIKIMLLSLNRFRKYSILNYLGNCPLTRHLSSAMLEHRKPDPRGMTKLKPWVNNS